MIHAQRPRRGAATVPALVCLVLVAILCGVMLKQGAMNRAVVRDFERRAQADRLAESALARAAVRLAADRAYKGETWEVPAADLGRDDPGRVQIAVSPVDGRADRARIDVRADYPAEGDAHTRRTQSIIVTVTPGPETSGG